MIVITFIIKSEGIFLFPQMPRWRDDDLYDVRSGHIGSEQEMYDVRVVVILSNVGLFWNHRRKRNSVLLYL